MVTRKHGSEYIILYKQVEKKFLILLSIGAGLIIGWSCYFKAYPFIVLEFYFEVIHKSM